MSAASLNAQQPPTSIPTLLNSQQPAPMPQFILASGQLVQGIQGAQLLIPTSQGRSELISVGITPITPKHFAGFAQLLTKIL